MKVEIVWGDRLRQTLIELEVADGCSLAEAVQHAIDGSQLSADVVDWDRVGIFGRLCEADQQLRAGDRIELYRPLQADPKEVRRALADLERAQKGTVV